MVAPAQAQRKTSQQEVADPAAIYASALKSFNAYDFDKAESELERYSSAKGASEERIDELNRKIELGRSMLERVEKIAVIDSLCLDAADFFKAYKISPSAGRIFAPEELPEGLPYAKSTTAYSTESGDHLYWGIGSADSIRIATASLLADGRWESPVALDEAINTSGTPLVNYPFVMADGVTLYFASNDPETSLGGYDIFMSRYDGEKYLEAQNIGMPYNSPANDYLLAIDENTGAGWWATDRNAPQGKVTVYIFVPEEIRVNYPADTPDLANIALLKNFASTQKPGVDYAAILEAINNLNNSGAVHTDDFEVAMPDGRVIRSLDQLASEASRRAMENYLDKADDLALAQSDIDDLRYLYSKGDRSVIKRILEGEKNIERMRSEVKRLLNVAVSTEMKSRSRKHR